MYRERNKFAELVKNEILLEEFDAGILAQVAALFTYAPKP
jgi:hypothetical protein